MLTLDFWKGKSSQRNNSFSFSLDYDWTLRGGLINVHINRQWNGFLYQRKEEVASDSLAVNLERRVRERLCLYISNNHVPVIYLLTLGSLSPWVTCSYGVLIPFHFKLHTQRVYTVSTARVHTGSKWWPLLTIVQFLLPSILFVFKHFSNLYYIYY